MDRLNHDAEIMAQHLAQSLVDLRRECFTSESLTELRFNHVECGLDVGPFVVVL